MSLADLIGAGAAELSSPSLLMLVWLHGFKGGDDTFESFPDRLTFLLSETCSKTTCKSLIYPAYDTRGSLSKATDVFLDWLTVKTSEHEAVHAEELKDQGKGDGKREQAYIVLLGHSMGGLLIADATLKLVQDRQSQEAPFVNTPLWPGIIGLVGYDTPYYGLDPSVFANAAQEYLGHAKTAHQLVSSLGAGLGLGLAAPSGGSSSQRDPKKSERDQSDTEAERPQQPANSWWKVGLAAASVAGLAAAAGTTYWQKDKIAENVNWATSHLDYVGELWKTQRLSQRLVDLLSIEPRIGFHCFYTKIPKVDSLPGSSNRHFIVVPSPKTEPIGVHRHFSANQNALAANEINAHTTMFSQKANSGYWALGKESARLVSEWLTDAQVQRTSVERSSGASHGPTLKAQEEQEAREAWLESARVRMMDEMGEQGLRDEL